MTARQTIALTTTAACVSALAIWVRFSASRWQRSLTKFRSTNHGYTTTTSSDGGNTAADTLLVVCPASGGGKAMEIYSVCLNALERRGLKVEVYVTESSQDLINLTATKDMTEYSKMIAVLSGDSAVYEMIQTAMRSTNGKWPYAPILVLPGGSSNVLSSEFHGLDTGIPELVEKSTVVRKGSVIKCTADSPPGGGDTTIRYTVHCAFDGCFPRVMVENMEGYRSTLYPAFGKLAIFGIAISGLLSLPFKSQLQVPPAVLSIFNSDTEAQGIDLSFGVNRFDDKLIAVYQSEYKGLVSLVKSIGNLFSGKMGQDFRDNETFENGLIVNVTDSFTVKGDGHYRVFMDGTSVLPIEGESITFQVETDAIPYFVFDEKDLAVK